MYTPTKIPDRKDILATGFSYLTLNYETRKMVVIASEAKPARTTSILVGQAIQRHTMVHGLLRNACHDVFHNLQYTDKRFRIDNVLRFAKMSYISKM
ncbi:MAG: hypothetical protein COV07_00210 [Candidatus Vogelbacteria bacterium CG10_big_fil_rev_8_21_14_0_10_45_14]|uniref:Uncharacterized protein n=1 Tax=Candidatus Vogelbacteria bacterium CG10_big_fil_rev_8_21_14_0_10_45_14 TaxID=1975042 RepID=A0A2H0RKY0_9BACT|nr:MAG: hypothetical protein COV07_00210 [Candidatus Vogelbacteria bacterium CG10_big_fil_rev_8_21_14_0_10_45_14]